MRVTKRKTARAHPKTPPARSETSVSSGRIPYPPVGVCGSAEPGGMRASRPTAVRVVAAPRLAADPPLVVGEGFIPPADTCGSARSPGRCKHRPLQRFAISQKVRLPGWPRTLPFRRGGFHIRPWVFAPPRFPGWSLCFPPSCRAGVHARRTLAISKIGTLRRRRARRDEGIPPYGCPGGCGFPVGRSCSEGL